MHGYTKCQLKLLAGLPDSLWYHTQSNATVILVMDGTLGTRLVIKGALLTECVVLGNLSWVALELLMALEP